VRIFLCFVVIIVSPCITSVGEDAQVIRSPKSILTIYSYGYGAAPRFAPELPERTRRTAALSDVVVAPPLSLTVPLRPRSSADESPREMAAPTIATEPKTANSTSAESDGQPSLTRVPVPPLLVSVGWQPSPDQSVVGYNLYIGDASHQYTTKQSVGNQTVAQLPIDENTIYVAVSAYTAEGLESQLSEELTVSLALGGNATTSAAVGGAASSQ